MSAGPFQISTYDADYQAGAFHGVRVQPETIGASCNSIPNQIVPAPEINSPISAIVGKSTRSPGLHTRLVRLKNPTAPPTGYTPQSRTQIPALSQAFYAAALLPGATVVYLGTTWEVAGTRPEKVR